MELFCPKCKEMSLIKFNFLKKGKVIVIIKCKCGRKFDYLSTFIVDYTNILKNKEKSDIIKSIKFNPKPDKNLQYFCETCFQNIYNDEKISNHDNHN